MCCTILRAGRSKAKFSYRSSTKQGNAAVLNISGFAWCGGGAHNFEFCSSTAAALKRTSKFEMVTEYHKFPADRGDPEVKTRPLLGRWKRPER
jgi:hypothetical protein